MLLSIIIVNYNVKYFLEQCLFSVRKACATIQAEVIVVDNASADGSMEYLLDTFPEVVFIDNPQNVGFSKANNQGLARAGGDYVLFLNPDTILAEDSLVNCIHFLDTDPETGACGVRMLDGSGRFLPESKRSFPGITTSFYKLSGLSSLFPRSARFGKYHLSHLSEFENAAVDILSGAFFLAKKKVLDETGGFDEDFFMYGEDIDLSYRIRQQGYKNYYFAGTAIIHFKGESTKRGTLDYVKMFYSAMTIFVRKHYRNNNLTQLQAIIRFSIWLRASASVVKNLVTRPLVKNHHRQTIFSLVLGSGEDAGPVQKILKDHAAQTTFIQVPPSDTWMSQLTGKHEIIFCVPAISYKEIIALMQQLPVGISFYIHATGSGGIVGSDSGNSGGRVIAG